MFTTFIEAVKLLLELVQGAKSLAAYLSAHKEETWYKQSAEVFGELRKTLDDKTITDEVRTERLKHTGRGIRDLLNNL